MGRIATARDHPRYERGKSRYREEPMPLLRAKALTQSWLTRHPALRHVVLLVFRSVQQAIAYAVRRLARVPCDAFLVPDRILWVSPADVNYKSLAPGSSFRNLGCGWILDGDWDAFEHPFVNDIRYRAVRDVLEGGLPWTETDEFAHEAASVDKGVPMRHCLTRADLEARYAKLDDVVRNIRSDGYLSQRELHRRRGADPVGRDDEVTVAVGRHGQFLFVDGAHRLAMAKLLGVSRLPVRVVYRHPDWMRLRRHVADAVDTMGGIAPQPIPHPDLDNIPARQRCAERFDILRAALPAGTRVLDLVPGWGYFCRRLADDGHACTAVATSRRGRPVLEALSDLGTRLAVIAPEDLHARADGDGFDVALALHDGLPRAAAVSLEPLAATIGEVRPGVLLVEPAAFVDGGRAADDVEAVERVLATLRDAGGYTAADVLLSEPDTGPLVRLS